jgi:hypothetical protein
MTQSCQTHLCDVVKSIGMGSSNIGYFDAKWYLNNQKNKIGAIWFIRPNILIMYHWPFGSILIKRKVNTSSWFLWKVPMCNKIEIMEFVRS